MTLVAMRSNLPPLRRDHHNFRSILKAKDQENKATLSTLFGQSSLFENRPSERCKMPVHISTVLAKDRRSNIILVAALIKCCCDYDLLERGIQLAKRPSGKQACGAKVTADRIRNSMSSESWFLQQSYHWLDCQRVFQISKRQCDGLVM